ncbi:Exocyst complex component 4 [Frankliniella fusca]|uniref:Exocyst complex component Sec8 n=1 Tax=Frankliniella fusca TaxID=407009 RepID=A0AAE1H3Y3_9NEOP|nr:Exocyst complex component 4 [Frankliniella fusca]
MSVIRTLSASESNEQRDREKAKLEKEYKRSDQRLDELISLHHNDLTQVMQAIKGAQVPSDDFDLSEDFDTTNPQMNPEHFIAVLIECLAVLGKIPEAVESLKVQMQSELLGVVSRTTRALLDGLVLQVPISTATGPSLLPAPVLPNGSITPSQVFNGDVKQKRLDGSYISNNQPNHPLPELLYTLLDQFRRIADGHQFVLKRLSHTCEKYNLKNIRLYEISDIWSMVQAVMQLVLNDYLDIQNTAADNQQSTASFSEPSCDISFYFSRRKIQRPKKMPLFKFEHSLSIANGTILPDNSDFKMHSDGRLQRDKLLICPSDPHNITLIFIPITKFIEEIEMATNCKIGVPCTLNAFLADYIKEVFLGRYQSKMSSTIEMVTKSPEAWRATITPEQMKEMRRTRPLLQSTVLVESCVKDLHQLIMALPVYTEHFLSIVTNLLRTYRENCQAAYRGKVQPESEDKRIFSAAFLKDEDISRFIKSLPNWANLQAQKAIHLLRQKRRALHREETTDEESPEDIRQRNEKEAEILASALGEGGVSHHEIISDVKHLRSLALLQESMEWFACCIYTFASELPRISPTQPVVRVMSEVSPAAQNGTVEGLQQLAKEFEDLADTCLLVLHLEVRVQCFHYLLPKVKDYGRLADCGMDSQEPDPKVLELTRALTSCDEALTNILQPLKCRYVFEGLGHFMSKILMSVAQYIDKIDEGGIQKMCRNIFTLQQTLTNITMTREVALDHARHYYELFYLTPEEILSGVVEKGPQFSELEYMNAFQLVHRSYPDQDVTALNGYMSRLSDILGEVGVTV